MNESWRRLGLSEYFQRWECEREGKVLFGGGGLDRK